MPQLMPLGWLYCVVMGMFIFIMMIISYDFISVELNLFKFDNSIITFNWCW